MIRLLATLVALSTLLALSDVPELEPFDEEAFDDLFDRLERGDEDEDEDNDDEAEPTTA
jgi:hypothetical protein